MPLLLMEKLLPNMNNILMFHRIMPKSMIDIDDAYFIRGTLISQERLENIIQSYLQDGFSFKTISEIDNSDKQIALTFDDGYLDNYLYVKPLLEKHNIKATFYPVIGYCKEQRVAPLDQYYHYVNENVTKQNKNFWITGERKRYFLSLNTRQQKKYVKKLNSKSPVKVSYMTEQQLLELYHLGNEIGGHSYYHDIYTNLSENEIIKDVAKTLNSFTQLGIKITSYAYTDGQYDLKTINILKNNNIKSACAIKSLNITNNYDFEIERKFVTENEII